MAIKALHLQPRLQAWLAVSEQAELTPCYLQGALGDVAHGKPCSCSWGGDWGLFQRYTHVWEQEGQSAQEETQTEHHNSCSSDFWLLLQLLLFASTPSCFCQTCCFLVPFICPSHIPVGNPLLSYTGCLSWDTALPGEALPGATQGLAPDVGSGQTLLPQP